MQMHNIIFPHTHTRELTQKANAFVKTHTRAPNPPHPQQKGMLLA